MSTKNVNTIRNGRRYSKQVRHNASLKAWNTIRWIKESNKFFETVIK